MVITRGKGEWREAEEGKEGINGDGRRLDLGGCTQYSILMLYYTTIHLKPIQFY